LGCQKHKVWLIAEVREKKFFLVEKLQRKKKTGGGVGEKRIKIQKKREKSP